LKCFTFGFVSFIALSQLVVTMVHSFWIMHNLFFLHLCEH